MKTAVVAIGGNAILRAGEEATLQNQMRNLRETSDHLACMIKSGYDMVLTHGNGPQVGDILLQNELAMAEVPPMPLDVCVAESQGFIGYMIQQTLGEALTRAKVKKVVTCVLTRVLVDADDPAFERPTKPVGPFYSEQRAMELRQQKGWDFIIDSKRGGYRRVVPSPRPLAIIEKSGIRRMVFGGVDQAEVVVASGGGGIPVILQDGVLRGVEAVVDKDLAAAVLAIGIEEKLFIMLTDVDHVYIDFNSKKPRPIFEIGLAEFERLYEQGQFPPGSMGPKAEAAITFLRNGGERVIITSTEKLDAALEGKAGTRISL
jgi:carbamate kinase